MTSSGCGAQVLTRQRSVRRLLTSTAARRKRAGSHETPMLRLGSFEMIDLPCWKRESKTEGHHMKGRHCPHFAGGAKADKSVLSNSASVISIYSGSNKKLVAPPEVARNDRYVQIKVDLYKTKWKSLCAPITLTTTLTKNNERRKKTRSQNSALRKGSKYSTQLQYV